MSGPALISALEQRMQLVRGGLDVVFIGVAASIGRYADILTSRLPAGFSPVRPIALEPLRQTPAEVPGPPTHAICLVFHRREVADLLAGHPTRVLSVVSELEPEVHGEIDCIPAGARLVLVARPETRPIYEQLVRDRRPDLMDLFFMPARHVGGAARRPLARRACVAEREIGRPGAGHRLSGRDVTLRRFSAPSDVDEAATIRVRRSGGGERKLTHHLGDQI